jgi:uracil-DNA glycosylase
MAKENSIKNLIEHQKQLSQCASCAEMIPPVIVGKPTLTSIMSVGQAPGVHEGKVQKPFGWTAGKTLFQWFETIGVDEESYRQKVYMAAVCRCFPGKNPKGGGDRVPNKQEIETCSHWLQQEYIIIKPQLLIPIGRLAMEQYLEFKVLTDVVGKQHTKQLAGNTIDIIPLPHPSGLSTWFRKDPGKSLLEDALNLISEHKAWKAAFNLNP